ncbi:efflux RND transporter permease subunit [uncultured Bacteroides sp.]|uniref:efflux RND transporter permease subunit n=1 Tax=uncultured Bacteroides sp. TaxID=162156 RepID=UPI002AABD0EF|nr:efflux RND transporter permease subunit [uncultured Bacteroides sp.]
MPSIVETSLKKPLLIVVIFTVLALGGLVSYNMLNLNLLPKFQLPMLTIQTVYPGAGASEVETSVTKKMEDALSTLENLKKISSTSMEGVSVIAIELNDGADPNQAVQDAQRKINVIKSDLPTGILDPSIDKLSLDEAPIMNIAASASLSSTKFYKLVEDRIQPRLAKLHGVGSVKMTGGNEREIKVNMDANKLRAYNISPLQVLQAIQMANMEIPAGNVENVNSTYSVRLAAKYSNLNELRNTVIKTTAIGEKVKIMDVAEVEDGIATQKLINRINGRDAIGIAIKKQSDANAVKVADLVKAELASIEKEYKSSQVKFEIASDDSVYTRASANAVVFDLFLAIVIVSIVCFIFLHNLRSAMIVMIAVPLSIIPSFIVMYFMGFSLNLMSLMALSLVVGILVDDSIVVIENMFRYMEAGKSKWQAALEGCKQILFTCMAITIVIVVVFLPLAISGGLIGNILREFAFPIIIATLSSLFVSFTVTPLLMSRFGKLSDDTKPTLSGRFSRLAERTFDSVVKVYSQVLVKGLKHKVTVFIVTLVLLIGSFSLIPAGFIGFSFVPNTDQGMLTVTLDMDPQVTVFQNNQTTMQAEKIISRLPEVERIYTNVGLSGSNTKNNVSTIDVKLVDKKERNVSIDVFAQKLKAEIMQVPGVRARVSVKGVSGDTTEPIQFIVQGTDFEKVQQTAALILNAVRHTPGTNDAKFSIDDPRQEVKVKLDRDKMATLGLSSSDVGSTLRVALNGNDDLKYTEGDFEYKIRVGIDKFDKTKADDVSKLTFMNKDGKLIELNQFADITFGLGPSALERTDRIPSIIVKSNVTGRSSGTVGAEISAKIQGKIPDGVTVKEGGMLEQQSNAFGSLGYAFLAAIVLIYLIMVVLYDSLLDPIIVMFSIPLSLIGAFLALALTMNDLNIFSIIGLIVLIGLVAKNAILLVDFTNHMRRDKGMDTFNALIEAGKERLRPILMTTFAMIFGMLPIAMASGNGAEFKNGMAWVIIGGLASSMILTLVVVPVVYYIFDKLTARFRHYRKNRAIEHIKETLMEEEEVVVSQ